MTIKSFIILASLTPTLAFAKLPENEAAKLVNAIYHVEGGAKAKAPFGILSVRVSSLDHARKICFSTVQNNHDRWIKAGKPGEYVDFLADRYCPKSADPKGNRNWKRNIRAFLSK